MHRALTYLAMCFLFAPANASPPSLPPADAPALAALGEFAVGLRTITVPAAPGRELRVVLWYPALQKADATPQPYRHRIEPPPPMQPLELTTEALGITGAAPAVGRRPLVVLSHGYRGWPESMSYLAENLATKGYVVAGIDHADLPYRDAASFQRSFGQTMVTRARDQQAVIAHLTGRAKPGFIDSARVALVGYSMGGFGALATAGAGYDPASPTIGSLPSGLLADQLQGARTAAPVVKAVVAIAPWGAQPPHRSWSADALSRLKAPMLLIAGSDDDVSGYREGILPLFEAAVGAPRHLLTYREARHNVGGNPSASEARASFQVRELFDEPVWRHDRLNAINQHFITAFLDLYLKGEAAKAAHLEAPYPGFQPRWALGFDMRSAKPEE